jgi:hypothetical protein
MVVHEYPGVYRAFGLLNILSKALKEARFILSIAEDVCLVDAPNHDVVQGAGGV